MDAPALTSVVLLSSCRSRGCVVRAAVRICLYQAGEVTIMMSVRLIVCAARNLFAVLEGVQYVRCTSISHVHVGLIHTGATYTQVTFAVFPAVAAELNGTR